MKKHLFFAAALAASLSINAQYEQTLPLDYNDFFRADAINGEYLEKYEYQNTDQKSTSKPDGEELKADQWNRGGKTSDRAGSNPVIPASTLKYSNYIDNEKGKEIELVNLPLNGESTVTRASIYSLKRDYTYSNNDYYLAALVQINEATGKGDVLTFDGNYTANGQRGRLFVKNSGSGYILGLGWNGDPTKWSDELAFGTTHLVVMKIHPLEAGNQTGSVESASLYIDPDLSKDEAGNTIFATVDGTGEIVASGSTKGIKSIRGITVRQRSKIAGKLAGLRFGETWADVVKKAEATGMESIQPSETAAKKVMVDGQLYILRDGATFTASGMQVK